MTNLIVIKGNKKQKSNYRKLYTNAFINTLKSEISRQELEKESQDMGLDKRRKIVFYGVKQINATNIEGFDYELLGNTFNLISSINTFMSDLTPREFQTIFPIAKKYDGEKYGEKDYFYARKKLEEFGMDRVIGEELPRLLWDYVNLELFKFASQTMSVMSAIRRAEGEKGVMYKCQDKNVHL